MKTRKLNGSTLLGGLRYVPLVLWVAFFAVAFGYIFLASFSTTREIFAGEVLNSGVHLENYIDVWKNNHVERYFINSILSTLIPCLLIILIAAPAAYGMSIPQVLVVIPIYSWFVRVGLVGHLATLIILYTVLNVPYTVFFLTAFFSTVPSVLAEAAMIDGCSEFRALWKIIIPVASPGIITVTIFIFMNIWNEYFMALIFANGNDEIRTLSMGLQNIITAMTYTGDWAGLFAAVMIVLLPTVILYLFLSEKIVAGITAGSVKG